MNNYFISYKNMLLEPVDDDTLEFLIENRNASLIECNETYQIWKAYEDSYIGYLNPKSCFFPKEKELVCRKKFEPRCIGCKYAQQKEDEKDLDWAKNRMKDVIGELRNNGGKIFC